MHDGWDAEMRNGEAGTNRAVKGITLAIPFARAGPPFHSFHQLSVLGFEPISELIHPS